MNNARASFNGSGNGRAGRSESIAAFASNASRSNCNVSPERFTNGSRQVASSFLADCGPVATVGCDGRVKGDVHHLVVTHAGERFGELETFSSAMYSASIVLLMWTG
jgi:hypothetical protein